MDWTDWLRLLVLVGMVCGAYTTLKNRPKPFPHEGRVYYPLPDGRFCTRWGVIVKDPAVDRALRASLEARIGTAGPTSASEG